MFTTGGPHLNSKKYILTIYVCLYYRAISSKRYCKAHDFWHYITCSIKYGSQLKLVFYLKMIVHHSHFSDHSISIKGCAIFLPHCPGRIWHLQPIEHFPFISHKLDKYKIDPSLNTLSWTTDRSHLKPWS